MTTKAPVITGNELKLLRRGLSVTDANFAKYLGVTPAYYRKAERAGDEPVDVKEFKGLLEKLVEVAPRMVLVKLQTMQQTSQELKFAAMQLKKTEKWLQFESRPKGETPVEEAEEVEEDDGRTLASGGVDKRSCGGE